MSALHKVLVVDDDPVVGKSFHRVLSNKGYQVITAHDAHEALEQLRNSEYDMVFTDIRMPGMDGLELAETVKARRPWTPVVIVTGYGTAAHEQRAKEAGVTAFLHKPLSPEMIEGSAAEALHQAEAAAALPAPTTEAQTVEPATEPESRVRNVALFLAAPFIGLAYAVMLPFVGLGVLVWMAARELSTPETSRKVFGALRMIGKIVAAPFAGLAFAVLLPVVGTVALAWVGVQSLTRKQ